MRGKTTNRIQQFNLKFVDLENTVKSKEITVDEQERERAEAQVRRCTYPNLVTSSNYGGAEKEMDRGGDGGLRRPLSGSEAAKMVGVVELRGGATSGFKGFGGGGRMEEPREFGKAVGVYIREKEQPLPSIRSNGPPFVDF